MPEPKEPLYRLCIRTTDNPDMPTLNPAAIESVCSRCGHFIWVDSRQSIPFPDVECLAVCMHCAFQDPELRPSVVRGFPKALRLFFNEGVIVPFDKEGNPVLLPTEEEEQDGGLSGGVEGP